MQVWSVLHTTRWKYKKQKWRKKSPFRHHRTTLSSCIFATNVFIDNRKKPAIPPPHILLIWWISAHKRLRSVREFGAPLQILTGFASWQRYCTASSSGRQPNFAALNRGRHPCSAGRPSRWAQAHILVLNIINLVYYTNKLHGFKLYNPLNMLKVDIKLLTAVTGLFINTFSNVVV